MSSCGLHQYMALNYMKLEKPSVNPRGEATRRVANIGPPGCNDAIKSIGISIVIDRRILDEYPGNSGSTIPPSRRCHRVSRYRYKKVCLWTPKSSLSVDQSYHFEKRLDAYPGKEALKAS